MVARVLDRIGTHPTLEIVAVGLACVVVAVVIGIVLDVFLARAEREEIGGVAARSTALPASRRGPDSAVARRALVDGVPGVRIFEPRRHDDRAARLRATVDARQN